MTTTLPPAYPPGTRIRSTHPDGFRTGQWAVVVDVLDVMGRVCYQLRWPDGIGDAWPVEDPSDVREFGRPPLRFTYRTCPGATPQPNVHSIEVFAGRVFLGHLIGTVSQGQVSFIAMPPVDSPIQIGAATEPVGPGTPVLRARIGLAHWLYALAERVAATPTE